MRICFLIGNFPTYSGVSSQAVLQAKELILMGVEVEFGIIARKGELFACSYIFDPSLLPASYFFLPPLESNIKTIRQYFHFLRKIKKFDVVHFHGLPEGIGVLIPVLKLLGLKVIIKMTGLGINDPLSIRKGKMGWLNSRVFYLADKVIGTSKALCEAYLCAGFPQKKMAFIHNGVDCSRFFPLADGDEKIKLKKKLGFKAEDKIALFVGSFRIGKGIDLLLESFWEVRNLYPDLVLVIIGPICPVCPAGKNTEKELIEKIKDSLKIILKGREILIFGKNTERLFLTGPKRNIEEWMRAADIFLFPSRREGLPNVVLEAMATALPCVTLNIPEITGDLLINSEYGWCSKDSKISFTQAFMEVLSKPDEAARRGKKALQRANDIFSSKIIAEKLKSLYREVMRKLF